MAMRTLTLLHSKGAKNYRIRVSIPSTSFCTEQRTMNALTHSHHHWGGHLQLRTASRLFPTNFTPFNPPGSSQHSRRFPKPAALRFYSSTIPPKTDKTPKPPPKNANPSLGAASFKDLGATRTVKIVVIIAISIMATAETFTYGLWGWRKYQSWRGVDGERGE
jgi:hypothetical protein